MTAVKKVDLKEANLVVRRVVRKDGNSVGMSDPMLVALMVVSRVQM